MGERVRKFFWSLFFIGEIFFLFAQKDLLDEYQKLEIELSQGKVDILQISSFISQQKDPSFFLAKLFQNYHRSFLKSYPRSPSFEEFFYQNLSNDQLAKLFENLILQNFSNEAITEQLHAMAEREKKYGYYHYLSDLNDIFCPITPENAEMILRKTERIMEYKDSFRFNAILRKAAQEIGLKWKVVEIDYLEALLKKENTLSDHLLFQTRWLLCNTKTDFSVMENRVKTRLKNLLFSKIPKKDFSDCKLQPVNFFSPVDFSDKILLFFNTDCKFCLHEMEQLNRSYRGIKEIIFINTLYRNKEVVLQETERLWKEKGIRFKVFIDIENILPEKIGFSMVPTFLYLPPYGEENFCFEMKIPGNLLEKLSWLTELGETKEKND